MNVKSYQILVVCTGNTCRSPMAEAILRKMLADTGRSRCRVISAGVSAANGYPASVEAVSACAELGIDLSAFRSAALTEQLVSSSDLILVMSNRHRQYIREYFPEAESRTFLVGEFSEISGTAEVADPVGAPVQVFRKTAEALVGFLKNFVQKLPDLRKRQERSVSDFVVGADHRGITLKTSLLSILDSLHLSWEDVGAFDTEASDYPKFAFAVGAKVAKGEAKRGALVCGTGLGMAIAANKVRGVRAGVISTPHLAKMSRTHNNSNVIVMDENTSIPDLEQIIRVWWDSEFEGGRHGRRVALITEYEDKHIQPAAEKADDDS